MPRSSLKMFDGRLKVTICGAKDLQHTNLTVRFDELQLGKGKVEVICQTHIGMCSN